MQFQSLTPNPKNSSGDVIGGTQDNGTWAFTGSPEWFESIGGDGGQSAIDFANPDLRAHTYFDADIDVNHQGNNVTRGTSSPCRSTAPVSSRRSTSR